MRHGADRFCLCFVKAGVVNIVTEKDPGHNLVRTRCQLALAKDIARKKDELEWIVEDTLSNTMS